jgi:hypothetical protein
MLAANTIASTAPKVLLTRCGVRVVVDPYVEEMDPALVFAVVAADIGLCAMGLDYHGDSVQLSMTRVEDVTCHRDG